MPTYHIGETVICSITVENSGVLCNPGVSMEVEVSRVAPDVEVVVPVTDMVEDATGAYHYDFASEGCEQGNYEVKYIATDGTRISIVVDAFVLV